MTGILNILAGSIASAIKDGYFNLVTLLLPGNGTNGAQNNTFLDSSSNNFTITRNGNTTQGTFSPFSQTGWSNNISDTGSMTLASSTDFDQTSAFTVEFWCYPTDVGTGIGGYIYTTNTTNFLSIYYSNSKNFAVDKTGVSTVITSSSTYALSSWYHIALCYDGTTTRFFVNGTSVGSISGGGVASGTTLEIGGYTNANFFKGYISNLRVVKGTALYTSNFTPSTTPLTDITNTKLLMCNSNRFADTNTQVSAKTITIRGTPSVQPFSPFAPTAAYDAATNGGSGYFDGTGDNISVPSATALQLNTAVNWTIEAWVYPTTLSGDNGIIAKRGASTEYQLSHNSGIGLNIYTGATTYGSGKLLTVNQWQHCAATWDGTTLRFFVNGVQTPTTHTGISLPASSTNNFTVGANGTTEYFTGYICGARLVKGTAVYTASFTPPTAPPTAITNTSFLCNFTNAGITDATAKNVLETVGNAQISTTQSKFGGSSIYLDGTGDWLLFPSSQTVAFGTGDFTIEFWYYTSTTSGFRGLFSTSSTDGETGTFRAYLNNANTGMTMKVGTTDTNFTQTLTANAWVHLAFVRSGGTLAMYYNGTKNGTTASITNDILAKPLIIGANFINGTEPFTGYFDDIRISKYARYTATFTPPTAAFPLS